MQSSVHPKCKARYHVGNWPAYDRALVQRGAIPVWLAPDATATSEAVGVGTRGGQLQYSDLAIETALPLRLPYELPAGDDRQVSSQDRRSVKLRVRPPPAGTHQCHRATSAGSGMMLTVKLRLTGRSDAQYWGSRRA